MVRYRDDCCVMAVLPKYQARLVDNAQLATPEWYAFLKQNAGDTTALGTAITSILARLDAVEGGGVDDALIQGLASVFVAGTLANGIVQITLVGDDVSPGNTYYYGTGPDGAKGFFTVASAFTASAAGIQLTTGADGVTDIATDDDLEAVEALSGTGLATRTAADTWALRTLTGTTDRITVTNGDGVSGNPTINFADEGVQDVMAATLVAGTNITLTYSDGSGTITIDASGGGSTDPYWFGVVSQLDAAGADASTTINDVLGKSWTANGNAQIDTSLGYNTILFDGNDFIATPSGYDSNFDWGEEDWCIEYWIYPLSVTGFQNIARRSTGSSFGPFSIALNGANLRCRCSESGASWQVDVTGSVTISTSVLVHIAACRQGATFRQYVGGVQDGTGTFTGPLMTSTSSIYAGAQSDAAGGYNGHIRAGRITQGNCRYPGGITFTPEAAPFWTP